MLTKMTSKEMHLTIKSVVAAVKDIEAINSRAYDFLYLASGFIAHYNIDGFCDYYRAVSLRDEILRNQDANRWDNFREGEKDYEYYRQKGAIYQAICEIISGPEYMSIPLKANFCATCGQRI